jgi:16S rRNA (cytidine1402-2'-O)-methyltransferase
LIGLPVGVIPGASAVTTLVSLTGFPGPEFHFHGFLPREAPAIDDLAPKLPAGVLHVFFESPHRIVTGLERLALALAPCWRDVQACCAKELTKIHERVFAGPVDEVLSHLRAHSASEGDLGEWVFAVWGSPVAVTSAAQLSDPAVLSTLECLLEFDLPPAKVARVISQKFGVDRALVYSEIVRRKGGGT